MLIVFGVRRVLFDLSRLGDSKSNFDQHFDFFVKEGSKLKFFFLVVMNFLAIRTLKFHLLSYILDERLINVKNLL